MEKLLDRFLRYVKYDTQSDAGSDTVPSTKKQLDFLKLLLKEVEGMGLSDISFDEKGYLIATIPANNGNDGKTVAFLAHVDTSPDVSGKDVKPQIIEYKGGDITLKNGLVMSRNEFPELELYEGQSLVVTGGNTLLGADDKAGIAALMEMAQYFKANPEVKHGRIRIAFTPDEEIGRGMDHFDPKLLGADFAYTVDGGRIGEFEYESFNAAEASISITGRNVHPGYAKNKMINALEVARKIDDMVPFSERPQYTEGYEGYYHLTSLAGDVEAASMHYLIRDHSGEMFGMRKDKLNGIVTELQEEYGEGVVSVEIKDQYYNMREPIEKDPQVVELALAAMRAIGVEPVVRPIRGGTDGSRLSFMGVPCPNLFAGGENFHSRFEFLPVRSLEKSAELVIEIAKMI